ncbi:MAG: TonB-dependent receptor [Weeksellaceae bacterium]
MRFNYSKGIITALFTVFFATVAFSQVVITGSVVDGNSLPISNAEVNVVGSNVGTTTGLEGTFSVTSPEEEGVIEIVDALSGSKQIRFKADGKNTIDLGLISLDGDAVDLSSMVVVGRGVIDLSEDRQTPIATSVISAVEIQERAVGNVEFPEAMKNTPNVYVANQAGGFGDSQMFLRGFDQSNTAFLLNGQPINGMEDGKMYWSNWAGVSDIANGIQVQRGLGSSKLAISSVGGTVNIITKATDKKQGGFARFMTGNDSYFKGTVAYNTGLMDNGWGVSILLDHWQGWRKYSQGTAGQGQNYFLSVGKLMGDHNFNFMVFGAPQSHEQNFSKSLNDYEKFGLKYNSNYGYLNGERTTWRENYYHKPVINFNWDWTMSPTSSLSTVLYASFGRGGGTGNYGASGDTTKILDPETGLADFDQVVANNAQVEGGIGSYGNGGALRSSVNNHSWVGLVTSYENEITDELTFNIGGDVRFYKGDHFRQLANLFGLNAWDDAYKRYDASLDANGQYLVSKTFDVNPWAALFDFADEKDRIAYDNSEWINYQGAFGQLEYAVDNFSIFFQGAVSNQSYKKEERFTADHTQSDKLNRIGYNVKGGASFSFTENSTLFANAGYYSRQPFLDNIFEYGSIIERTPEVENEEITGLEAGYSYTMGRTKINLNGYYTKWANRFLGASGTWEGEEVGFRFLNIAQVHKGLELDFQTKPITTLMVRGYMTYNDFKYDGSTDINLVNQQTNEVFKTVQGDLTGTFVGDAPMVSAGLGTQWEPTKGFSVNADFNFYGKTRGFVDVEDVALNSIQNTISGTKVVYQADKINDYATVDVGAGYTLPFGKQDLKLRANVYNVFNNKYISRKDNYGYFYGNGTTWNASIRYDF